MSNYYPHFSQGQTPFKVMQDAGRFGHVQTTNNVLTEIARFSCNEYSSLTASMTIFITGIRTNGDACWFTQELGIKRINGGNAVVIGSVPSPKQGKDTAMMLTDFSVSTSGAEVVVHVKGLNGATIDWCCQVYVNHLFGVS